MNVALGLSQRLKEETPSVTMNHAPVKCGSFFKDTPGNKYADDTKLPPIA